MLQLYVRLVTDTKNDIYVNIKSQEFSETLTAWQNSYIIYNASYIHVKVFEIILRNSNTAIVLVNTK